MLFMLLVAVAIGGAIIFFRGQDWAAGEHATNYAELDIVGRTIEGWPTAMEGIARTNFLRDRIALNPDPAVRADGLPVAYELRHPSMGTMQLGYGLSLPENCLSADGKKLATDKSILIQDENMSVAGGLYVDQLYYQDEAVTVRPQAIASGLSAANANKVLNSSLPADPALRQLLAAQLSGSTNLQAGIEALSPEQLKCLTVRYGASLLASRVANRKETARSFDNLLLVGADGRLMAPLSGRQLPVIDIQDLLPITEKRDEAINKVMEAAAASGRITMGTPSEEEKKQAAEQLKQLALRAGKPLPVVVAGEEYYAYFRPMQFQGGWKLRNCEVQAAEGKAEDDEGRLTTTGSCMLVGLVRTSELRANSLKRSSDVVILVSLLVLVIVLLVPAAKLRYLGPAGDLKPFEVAAVIYGLVAATAMITLLVIVAITMLRGHARANAAIEATALQLADDFSQDLVRGLQPALKIPSQTADPMLMPLPETRAFLHCRFADGQPMATTLSADNTPEIFDPLKAFPASQTTRIWPGREAILVMGPQGRAFPGYAHVANRCVPGGRVDVSMREYFQQALDRESLIDMSRLLGDKLPCTASGALSISRRYSIGAVRSQSDGIAKVLVALPFTTHGGSASRLQPCDAKASIAPAGGGPRNGVLVVSIIPRSFLSPVLPPGQKFMVVDASTDQLRYLFGSMPNLIDIAEIAPAFEAREPVDIILRARETKRPMAFAAKLNGESQKFSAVSLPGTPWVLLAYQPYQQVVEPLSQIAVLAAISWFGLSLWFTIILLFIGILFRERLWLWLWPRPGCADRARRAASGVMAISAASILLLLLSGMLVFPWRMALVSPWLPWLSLLAPAAGLGWAWWVLERENAGEKLATESGAPHALMPDDERGYSTLLVGLLLLLAVVPASALWVGARHSHDMQATSLRYEHYRDSWRRYSETVRNMQRYLLIENAVLKTTPDKVVRWPGAPGLAVEPQNLKAHLSDTLPRGPIDQLALWAGYGWQADAIPACQFQKPGPKPDATHQYCVGADVQDVRLVDPLTPPVPDWKIGRHFSWPEGMAVLLGILGLIMLCTSARRGLQRGLFGFGTPLEAVRHPTIDRDEDGLLILPDRSVILNGQAGIEEELLENGKRLDLGSPIPERGTPDVLLMRLLQQGQTIVAVGLDIALKIPEIRETALRRLERLNDIVEEQRRVGEKPGRVVVMTDLSPLDRILQAYEREHSVGDEDGRISTQEQMRWSRLFEDFSTYSLSIVPKFSPELEEETLLKRFEAEGLSAEEGKAIRCLLSDVRFLPEAVLRSLEPKLDPEWKKLATKGYPIPADALHGIFFPPLLEWALKVRPANVPAAIDHLRGMLIEHYQHLWAASSQAERIILDNIARRRVVNIEAALAMRSLIRRGLVMLKPYPVLMSRSFGAFVRQAERPEAINSYRNQAQKGGWERVAKPVSLLVALGAVALIIMGAMAGYGIDRLLPILLGIGPALFTSAGMFRRAE